MELWNTDRVREELGAKTIQSASRTLQRLRIKPVSREPGRSGMNLYDPAEVNAAIAARPGRGVRTRGISDRKSDGETISDERDSERQAG
jgi:hypothetical protein